jgi:gentisate 1,2-dioxygenase
VLRTESTTYSSRFSVLLARSCLFQSSHFDGEHSRSHHRTPSWTWHVHANDTREDAILFSVQDTPILQALGLYRTQAYEANDGHQAITREFRP